jgi:hypothetical protein
LKQDQIDEACTETSTRLPPGLRAAGCHQRMRSVIDAALASAREQVQVQASQTASEARRQALEVARQAIEVVRQMNASGWTHQTAPLAPPRPPKAPSAPSLPPPPPPAQSH